MRSRRNRAGLYFRGPGCAYHPPSLCHLMELDRPRAMEPALRDLLNELDQAFNARIAQLVEARDAARADLRANGPSFREDTRTIREKDWQVAAIPDELMERRVELLGGCNRPDLITGMNAGAKSYIADIWDLNASQSWGIARAHRYLARAARLDLAHVPASGVRERINPATQTRLMVVPRPIAAVESSVMMDHGPVTAALFDMAMIMQHCATPLIERQGHVLLYLRDVRSQQEARTWAEMLHMLEEHFDLPTGTVRATVMIDSVTGALQAEEILFEMAHHAGGLSFDPQAYTADLIALHQEPDDIIFPDRERIGLNSPFLRALSHHLIGISHRRGCHAIGAPSFVLPPRDPTRPSSDHLSMLADKEREAVDGHDGTIVVHPDTVNPAMMEFNKSMPKANQLYYQRNDPISPDDLVRPPVGEITTDSLLGGVRTLLRALVQRLDGQGRVIQGSRLHDRSSVRLATRLLWQWTHNTNGSITATGLEIRPELVNFLVRKEAGKLYDDAPPEVRAHAETAVKIILDRVTGPHLPMEPL